MQVIFLGRDMVELGLVSKFPKKKTSVGQNSFIEQQDEIVLLNDDDCFSPGGGSMIDGIQLDGQRITVYDDDGSIFLDGYIDGEKTKYSGIFLTLGIQSKISRVFDQIVEYEGSFKSPATHVKQLLINYGLSEYIDNTSFGTSIAIYSNGNVLTNVDIQLSQGVKLREVLSGIANMGVAKIYKHDNKIYFDVHNPDLDYTETLQEINDIYDTPKEKGSTQTFNDYSLRYYLDGEVPVTDADGGGLGLAARTGDIKTWADDFSVGSPYTIMSRDSAIFLGNLKMLRDRYPRKLLPFTIGENDPILINKVMKKPALKDGIIYGRITELETIGKVSKVTFEEVK